MKFFLTFLCLTISCMAQDDGAVVRFSNGDQLTGKVMSLTLEKLVWDSPILKSPAEFDLRHVIDLTMPPGMKEPKEAMAGHQATLELTNGDTIHGQLSGLSDKEIRLKTSYAGELAFRRVNVETVTINRASDYYYRGPNNIDEWTKADNPEAWIFKGGALHSSAPGGIAREIDFPQDCSISFDAAWRGAFRPKIIFYSNDIATTNPAGGYEMVFQGNSVHVKKSGSNNWLGHSTNAGDLRENEKAHIEIRVSTRTGKILLFVDGELIDLWEDDEVEKDGLGKGFHIVSQDASPLRVSNIEVTSWDGFVEDLPNRQERLRDRAFRGGFDFDNGEDVGEITEEEKIPEGRMVLRNGDNIDGEVTGINGEEITIKTPLSEVAIPIARLKNLVLKKADMETPKRYKGDVRATLADGSKLVFRLDGVEGDSLIVFTQNFGLAKFARDAFKRIEFNIYDRDMEDIRAQEDW